MAGRERPRTEQQLPQFLVAFGVGLVFLTGAWLWWFGDPVTFDTFGSAPIDERLELQRWVLRIHVIASVAVLVGMFAMTVAALVRREAVRALLRGLFALALILGVYSGYQAAWIEARLWAANVGSRLGAFTGSGPSLPDDQVRLHLVLIPALLAITATASAWNGRRHH